MDFRDAKGPVVNPSGNVEQQFGDRNYYNINIPKPDELTRLPFIPEPPSDFTGRNEEQKELLAEYSAGKNIIGLRGIGGVGKTALALKLVESIKDRYPDGQIMVDMMGMTNQMSDMMGKMSGMMKDMPADKMKTTSGIMKDMSHQMMEMSKIMEKGNASEKEMKKMQEKMTTLQKKMSDMGMKK